MTVTSLGNLGVDHELHRHLPRLVGLELLPLEAEALELLHVLPGHLRAVARDRLAHDRLAAVLRASYSTCTSCPGCTCTLLCSGRNSHGSPRVLASNSMVTSRPSSTWVLRTSSGLLQVVDPGGLADLLVDRHQGEAEAEHDHRNHQQLAQRHPVQFGYAHDVSHMPDDESDREGQRQRAQDQAGA